MSSTHSLTNVVANIRHVLQEAEDCERYVFICSVEFVSARGFVWLRRRVAATSGPFGRFIDLQVLEKVAKTRDTLVRNSSAILRVLWLAFICLSLVVGKLADYSGTERNIVLRSHLVICASALTESLFSGFKIPSVSRRTPMKCWCVWFDACVDASIEPSKHRLHVLRAAITSSSVSMIVPGTSWVFKPAMAFAIRGIAARGIWCVWPFRFSDAFCAALALPLSLPLPLKLAPEASKNKSLRRFASRALLASHVVTLIVPAFYCLYVSNKFNVSIEAIFKLKNFIKAFRSNESVQN